MNQIFVPNHTDFSSIMQKIGSDIPEFVSNILHFVPEVLHFVSKFLPRPTKYFRKIYIYIFTDIYRKICRESTDRSRKIYKQIRKIHTGGAKRPPPLPKAGCVDFVHLFVDFLVRSADSLHIFMHISVHMCMRIGGISKLISQGDV